MKNNSNIYDIDGNLIRSIDDTHKWTAKEVREKIEFYRKKVEELGEDDEKSKVYTTYMANLRKYLFNLYASMSKDQIQQEIKQYKNDESLPEQVKKAMGELESELNNDGEAEGNPREQISGPIAGDSEGNTDRESGNAEAGERSRGGIHEETTASQDSLLVERDDVSNDMDEYVNFEEV